MFMEVVGIVGTVMSAVNTAVTIVQMLSGPEEPKPVDQTDQLKLATVGEGEIIPILFGTIHFRSPNVVWYRPFLAQQIIRSGVLVGHRYRMSWHSVLCLAYEAVIEIRFNNRAIWTGAIGISPNSGQTETIDLPRFYGGDEGEGGVFGGVRALTGLPTQVITGTNPIHPYYREFNRGAVTSASLPGFRGTAGLYFQEFVIGNEPSPKPHSVFAKRVGILSTLDGNSYKEQWNPLKAPVAGVSVPVKRNLHLTLIIESSSSMHTLFEGVDGRFYTPWEAVRDQVIELLHKVYASAKTFGSYCRLNLLFVGYDIRSQTFDLSTDAGMSGAYGYLIGTDHQLTGNMSELDSAFVLSAAAIATAHQDEPDPDDPAEVDAIYDFVQIAILTGRWRQRPDGEAPTTNDLNYDATIAAVRNNGGVDDLFNRAGQFTGVNAVDAYVYGVYPFGNGTAFDDGTLFVDELLTLQNMGQSGVPFLGLGGVSFKNNVNDTYTAGSLADTFETTAGAYTQLNPAHILRECITDTGWGMGHPESSVDDASFLAAADTLYSEGMGMSILWDQQQTLETFIQLVLSHINGVLFVDRQTGLFTLNLIRYDYDTELLPTFNEDNIVELTRFERPGPDSVINTLTYTYRSYLFGKVSRVLHDLGMISELGGVTVEKTIDYPGFYDDGTAYRAAHRDFHALSRPLIRTAFTANRDALSLDLGDPFLLTWEEYGVLEPLVFRVAKLAISDGRDHSVQVEAVQDPFDNAYRPYLAVPTYPVEEQPVIAIVDTVNFYEVPYQFLVDELGRAATNSLIAGTPSLGYAGITARQPDAQVSAGVWYLDEGSGYESVKTIGFSAAAEVATAVGLMDTEILVENQSVADLPTSYYAQIGTEIVYVTQVVDNGDTSTLTVLRGTLDTVPAEHAVGTNVIWFERPARNTSDYADGDGLDTRVVSLSANVEGDLATAPSFHLDMAHRAIRPYPPANLTLNGEYFPEVLGSTDIAFAWSRRNRLTQNQPTGFLTSDASPELAQKTVIEIYNGADELLRRVVSSETSYLYTIAQISEDFQLSEVDEYWADVVSLLHLNGTVTDERVTTTWQIASSDVLFDAAQKVFGSHSLRFTGASTSSYVRSDQVITLPASPSHFSLELWFRVDDVSSTQYLVGHDAPSGLHVYVGNGGTLHARVPGTSATFVEATNQQVVFPGQWYHLTLFREYDGRMAMLLDGDMVSATRVTSWTAQAGRLVLGARGYSTTLGTLPLRGYIDEFRLTVGTTQAGRYTALRFTPPATVAEVAGTQVLCDFSSGFTNQVAQPFVITPYFSDPSPKYSDLDTDYLRIDAAEGLGGTPAMWSAGIAGYPGSTAEGQVLSAIKIAGAWSSIGTQDFCIEFAFKVQSTLIKPLFGYDYGGLRIQIVTSSDGRVTGRLGSLTYSVTSSTVHAVNDWNHVAFGRHNGVLVLALNGYLSSDGPSTSMNYTDGETDMALGASGRFIAGHPGARFDNFRFVLGSFPYSIEYPVPDREWAGGSAAETAVKAVVYSERQSMEFEPIYKSWQEYVLEFGIGG